MHKVVKKAKGIFMANNSIFNSHYLEIMKAALPYMNPSAQKSVEILVKTEELIEAVQTLDDISELSAASIRRENVDPEMMLNQIKALCTKEEQVMIDNLLNIITMQKLIQGYRTFTSLQQNSSGNNNSSNDRLMEFLISQLTPEQKNNFDSINMVLNTMNH